MSVQQRIIDLADELAKQGGRLEGVDLSWKAFDRLLLVIAAQQRCLTEDVAIDPYRILLEHASGRVEIRRGGRTP